MSHIAASFCAGGNNRFAKQCTEPEHGSGLYGCRERGENSNASFVQPLFDSGFIAAIRPSTVEIFSAEVRRAPPDAPVRKPYPGANPNVRSKRLA
ncbi:MAG TPA: hypothetical protein VN831_26505 [Bradyrhizobium sp.]|nr:hypothetical protein [Bradyrhizobium sp.]